MLRGIEERQVARFGGHFAVGETQPDRHPRQQVLAFHVGKTIALVAVDPVEGLAADGADELNQADIVALRRGSAVAALLDAGEDRQPVGRVRSVARLEEISELEIGVIVKEVLARLVQGEIDHVIVQIVAGRRRDQNVVAVQIAVDIASRRP